MELLIVEVGCRVNVESDAKFVKIVIGVLVSIAKNAQIQPDTNRNAYKIPNLKRKRLRYSKYATEALVETSDGEREREKREREVS